MSTLQPYSCEVEQRPPFPKRTTQPTNSAGLASEHGLIRTALLFAEHVAGQRPGPRARTAAHLAELAVAARAF
jgi:hypothetical protein